MDDAEAAYRSTEARTPSPHELLELLVSRVVDYAIFALDADGRVVTWNEGARRLKGYEPDEIIGQHLSTFYTKEDRGTGVPQAGLAQARATGVWENEGWRVRKDGTGFWANVVITALRGDDGRLLGFAKVTRDLTGRKRAEDALREALERERAAAAQIRELDRMRSELVSTVAHDLRAPVGVVQALLHLLSAEWDESTSVQKREVVERLSERTEMLAALVDDVFDLVTIDAGHLTVTAAPIDVGGIVSSVVSDARTEHNRTDISASISPGAWAIGDGRRTWQVVANLLSNAVKFSPAGVGIEVEVGMEGDAVVVTVTDHGPGILPDQRDAVFERFTRLPGATGTPGSGLGLYIARSLVEAQGGRISLASDPGMATTFRVSLPRAADAAGSAS